MRIGHVALGLVLALLLVGAFVAFAWRPDIAPAESPSRSAFDAALIAKGAALATIGNCNTCHTAHGGAPYAGGRPLKTSYGTVFGVNITPDPETGLGRWSEAAFARAMREGVSRDGRHLYPAFPYDHYAAMPDEDIRALYAFLMTRDPVSASAPANDLRFPFNIRMLIAAWKALYFHPAAPESDETQSAEWNRGAYLVQGPAHCGACHTPRNLLGAEKKRSPLAGGEAEGWHAPALSAASPAPLPWNTETLYRYLRYGNTERHAVAAGPMAEVVRNLAAAPEQEVRAIAVYIATLAGEDTSERRERTKQVLTRAGNESGTPGDASAPLQGGRAIYAHACAGCHGTDGRGASSGNAMNLVLSTALYLPTPRNLLQIILNGVVPPDGERGRWMPGFDGALTDEQVVQLARFLRTELARAPAWRDLEDELQKVEREKERQLAAANTK